MQDFRMSTFLSVCRTLNYTRSAAELNITQPAVSQHIAYLEKAYGAKLLSYRGKKLALTPAGEPLLDPADQQSIDLAQLEQMVDAFLEGGGTYFDTAFVYHEGASEKALGQALVARHPRESFTIATKCLAWAIGSAEEAKSNLGTSLERLGTDYIDFYLLHNVGGPRTAKFDEYGMWDFVREQKAAGRIRNWGFSMHDGPRRSTRCSRRTPTPTSCSCR